MQICKTFHDRGKGRFDDYEIAEIFYEGLL